MLLHASSLRARAVAARLALPALALSLLSSCRAESLAKPPVAEQTAREVRAVAVERGVLAQVVRVAGTLAAEERAVLGMKTGGRVARLFVDLGSRVRAGQPLAQLDPADFDLRVRQAEAALEQARARLGLTGAGDEGSDRVDIEQTAVVRQARAVLVEARLRRERFAALFEQKLVAQSERDAAESAYLVADSKLQDALEEARNRQAVIAQRRSELALARQQKTDSILVAPFDGAIAERQVAPGQFVAAGQPVVTLVRVDPLRLRLEIPERESPRVRVDQKVTLRVEGDDASYTGRIARVSPAIDETTRTLSVEVEVPNADGRLRPGSFARSEVVTAADQPALLVPASALTTFAGVDKVILVKDGKSVEKRVVVGRRAGDRVEIVEGVAAGDVVVLEPGNLVGGRALRVVDGPAGAPPPAPAAGITGAASPGAESGAKSGTEPGTEPGAKPGTEPAAGAGKPTNRVN